MSLPKPKIKAPTPAPAPPSEGADSLKIGGIARDMFAGDPSAVGRLKLRAAKKKG